MLNHEEHAMCLTALCLAAAALAYICVHGGRDDLPLHVLVLPPVRLLLLALRPGDAPIWDLRMAYCHLCPRLRFKPATKSDLSSVVVLVTASLCDRYKHAQEVGQVPSAGHLEV